MIPAAEDLADDTLLSFSCSPVLPRPNETAGGFDWAVKGVYVYAQDTPRTPGTDALPVGQFPFALPVQDALARSLGNSFSDVPTFSGYYNAIGNSLFDPVTGTPIWPFLALPATFTSTGLI